MMNSMDDRASGAQPLHIRITEERVRRGWTQKEVAERAGLSLRTYNSFENGKSSLQGRNLRSVMAVFEMDETEVDLRETTLEGWAPEIMVFLDMMGAFLSTMSEAERLAFMHDVTRRIVDHRE